MREKIKLTSVEEPKYCYYTTKNKKTMTAKLEKKMFHPKLRRHVMFREEKLK